MAEPIELVLNLTGHIRQIPIHNPNLHNKVKNWIENCFCGIISKFSLVNWRMWDIMKIDLTNMGLKSSIRKSGLFFRFFKIS